MDLVEITLTAEDGYRLGATTTDDAFAPLSAVEALRALYPKARWETRRVAPREVGANALGHFVFFRERFRDSLWREAVDWLERP